MSYTFKTEENSLLFDFLDATTIRPTLFRTKTFSPRAVFVSFRTSVSLKSSLSRSTWKSLLTSGQTWGRIGRAPKKNKEEIL